MKEELEKRIAYLNDLMITPYGAPENHQAQNRLRKKVMLLEEIYEAMYE